MTFVQNDFWGHILRGPAKCPCLSSQSYFLSETEVNLSSKSDRINTLIIYEMIIEKLIIEHKHSEFLDSKSVNFDIQKKPQLMALLRILFLYALIHVETKLFGRRYLKRNLNSF